MARKCSGTYIRLFYMVSAILLGVLPGSVDGATGVGTAPQYREQTFEAWGTSLAWWANEVGEWGNVGLQDQLLESFFNDTNHLGLNYARYNIGGGQNPGLAPIPRPGANIEGWVPTAPSNVSNPATWQFDFSADQTQRLVLDKAIALGVTQVEAFSNSAPWWMTISQDVTGHPTWGQSNLSQANFDEFAYYLAEVAEHFEVNEGIRFDILAPMNEPGSNFWTSPGNQEGMVISMGTDQALLIQAVGAELASRGTGLKLAGPEETSASDTIKSWNKPANDNTTIGFIDRIHTHTYPFNGGSSDSKLAQLRALADSHNKEVYVTEFGTGNSSNLEGGLTLANQITSDLRILKTPAWTYWQALENNNGSGWGLMTSPFTSATESIQKKRQFEVMRQFTSYIRPGSYILDVSDDDAVASYDPRTDTTTIVLTNDGNSSTTRDYDLIDKSAEYTRVIRTTGIDSFKSMGSSAVNGSEVSITASGNSVTTLVIHNAPNLLDNPNFDLGGQADGVQSISNWQAQGDAAFYSSFDHSGDGSGTGVLYADQAGHAGALVHPNVGDADTDLTGVAYQLSADLFFQNQGADLYDADLVLGLEFYGYDGQALTHQNASDFQTAVEPSISVGSGAATDSVYRVFRSDRFVAPAGTRYVRPVIGYSGTGSGSTDWVYVDNVYLQAVHPQADGREWTHKGSGTWDDRNSWLNHALVEKNDDVYFGNAITANATVLLTSSQQVESITFFSEYAYRLFSSNKSLQVGAANTPGAITSRMGAHQITVDTQAGGDLSILVLPGSSIEFDTGLDANGNVVTKLGAGQFILTSGFQLGGGRLVSYATDLATITLGSDAVLDGDLEVLLSPGHVVGVGEMFELLSYSSLSDTFDDHILPTLPASLAWDLNYGATALTLEVVAASIAGDLDGDGFVGITDLNIVLGNWNLNVPPADAAADPSGDDFVGIEDLNMVLGNWNAGVPPTSSAPSIPEPSSGSFVVVISVVTLYRRIRRV